MRWKQIRAAVMVCLCAGLVFGLWTGTARAQQPTVKLSQLQIDIWPEYDQPSVLVIYRMTLSTDTPLPAQISLRIPREVGKPHKVAQQSIDGLLYDLEYTIFPSGDWLTIQFTALSQLVRVEYYDPRLETQGMRHSFKYQWPADFDVDQLVFSVQQPLGAARFEIQPQQGVGKEGQDGIIYYTIEMKKITADTLLWLDILYESASQELTHVLQPVFAMAPIQESRIGWSTFIELLPLGVLVFGALIIAGSVLWYWQSGDRPRLKLRGFALPQNNRSAVQEAQSGVYCRECGKRAHVGDSFCRACGSRLPNSLR